MTAKCAQVPCTANCLAKPVVQLHVLTSQTKEATQSLPVLLPPPAAFLLVRATLVFGKTRRTMQTRVMLVLTSPIKPAMQSSLALQPVQATLIFAMKDFGRKKLPGLSTGKLLPFTHAMRVRMFPTERVTHLSHVLRPPRLKYLHAAMVFGKTR